MFALGICTHMTLVCVYMLKFVYMFVYIPGSKPRTADQWLLDTQRSVESSTQQLTRGLAQGGEWQLPAAPVAEASGTQPRGERHEAPFPALLHAGQTHSTTTLMPGCRGLYTLSGQPTGHPCESSCSLTDPQVKIQGVVLCHLWRIDF